MQVSWPHPGPLWLGPTAGMDEGLVRQRPDLVVGEGLPLALHVLLHRKQAKRN